MSDERVNVSKDLLDDLSDSVQALTGTTEKMAIQEMSAAEQYKEQIAYTESLRAKIRELEGTE